MKHPFARQIVEPDVIRTDGILRIVDADVAERETMIAYIEAKAQRIRDKADSGEQGWALARHDSTVLFTVASDLRAGLDNLDGVTA